MKNKVWDKAWWVLLGLGVLLSFAAAFWVNKPVVLSEESTGSEKTIPIETVLAIVQEENAAVRGLYTREIVGAGQEVGLVFDADWQEPAVQAGPLPALFLRETAQNLEKSNVPLRLFLGSDFPINPANRFQGVQAERFALMRQDGQAQFFFASDTGFYIGMFPDLAQVDACVTCHNGQAQSSKKDWKVGELMGGVSWLYPEATVTVEEALAMIAALRESIAAAYAAYLGEITTFDNPPEIGVRWPSEGYYLPSVEMFMLKVEIMTSASTLQALMEAVQAQ